MFIEDDEDSVEFDYDEMSISFDSDDEGDTSDEFQDFHMEEILENAGDQSDASKKQEKWLKDKERGRRKK